jgi:hypothetical protein
MVKAMRALALGIVAVERSAAQGMGNGVAKGTYASSNPTPGLEFLLKYLPTTVRRRVLEKTYAP